MIKRDILSELQKHLEAKEITLITGPRQAGKTYLMQILKQEIDEKHGKTLFLNLDLEQDRHFFVSQNELIRKIRLHFGEEKGVVFIDEIQRKENAGLFLKGLYDMNLSCKFVISGSGSLELKEKIHESLVGRKRIFEVNPITFNEFVQFKTNYQYENSLKEFFTVETVEARQLLEEYLSFGGYPRVILSPTALEKQKVMGEIYQSYLERDLKDLLHLEKTEELTRLIKILASQLGGIVNISELSSTIGISTKTVQKYIWYLEKTFILKRVAPFFRNVRKEVTKAPMYYFYDTGFRNYILGLFGVPTVTLMEGHLFENFVFNSLKDQILYISTDIHFWRTRDNAEVDFVIETGMKVTPIEVKYTCLTKPQITRSFRSFLTKYKPPKGFIVHLGEKFEEQTGNTNISFVPYYEITGITNL